MSNILQDDQWVWVVVEDPGGNEQLLGQHDDHRNVSFIPAFLEKEAAQNALSFLPQVSGLNYEVQAIQLNDLTTRAFEKAFKVYLLNGLGHIIEKLEP